MFPEERVEERFALPSAREGWLELLPLAHATLPLPEAFVREGDELVVVRRAPPGRPVREGRVPRELAPQLLLQAAAALAFFRAFGFGLDEEDLAGASWDRERGSARLWLPRSPASLTRGAAPPPSRVLAAFLETLDARGGSRADRGRETRALANLLGEPEARSRRAESLVAAVFRSFPSLGSAGAALARQRTAGWSGGFLRELSSRAAIAAGRAALEGRRSRLFVPRGPALRAGSALPLDPPAGSASEASRRLRALASEDAEKGRTVWIAAGQETWDDLSLRAFETAARFLPAEVDVRRLPGREPAPALPDEWRREFYAPCGTIAASLRFYEWLAEESRASPDSGGLLALECLASERWAAFASDPTGDTPVPGRDAGEADGRTASSSTAGLARRSAEREPDPARRIELYLQAGLTEEALDAARRWRKQSPRLPPEAWFELSARLSSAGASRPSWLELLEAERLAAGGEPGPARALFEKAALSPDASAEERRGARLRAAEISVGLEGASEAARRAADWRRDYPGAAASETMRALRLESVGLARGGSHGEARVLLAEAERLAEGEPEAERIENALAGAAVLSLQGAFEEEAAVYERWRPAVSRLADDALAARFVSVEALSLSDRRRPAEAAARLEEALAVLRDDSAQRARLSIDLAATLYHAGRSERCAALLEDAARLAATAGRRDLLRLARSNGVELAIAQARWEAASAAIAELLAEARRSGDDLWLLVALHHRSRAALRQGELVRAAEDNAAARQLAERLGDRLEVGELWLEEGDRLLYEGSPDAARHAWERAAADPPDRCDTERVAEERLRELDGRRSGGPPAARRDEVSGRLLQGEYAAAETVGRWRLLYGASADKDELFALAERFLRERGGGALADRLFGPRGEVHPVASIPIAALRELREALACALSGSDGAERLAALGLTGLALEDAEGKLVLRLGQLAEGEESARVLEAGAARYRLILPRAAPEPLAGAAALLAETLLFRSPASFDSAGFVEGWRRLGIVTGDTSMEEPWRRLVQFAAQSVTVLVHGESGSGKEAVARAVHALSPRAQGPFVPVNVPAIPAALLESELFGHVRGAFTGAERDRAGLLEEASHGTLFLDEIADLAPPLQAKLLRTLQDRELRRVGENRSRRLDVRVVSATSRDLAREVEAGRFREDLFYRLHVAVIELPPLHRRGRDVQLLARHFLDSFGRDFGRGSLRLAPEAAAALAVHPWPGNVRELQNAMAQAAALADRDGIIGLPHLPEALRRVRPRPGASESYRSRLDAHRKGMISEALERAGGNRSLAARQLGLSRQALRYLVQSLGIQTEPGAAPERRAPAGSGREADRLRVR